MSKANRPRDKKKNPCSTQVSIKFIMLINVKIPTIVGIFTFISMITSESLKAKKVVVFFSTF